MKLGNVRDKKKKTTEASQLSKYSIIFVRSVNHTGNGKRHECSQNQKDRNQKNKQCIACRTSNRGKGAGNREGYGTGKTYTRATSDRCSPPNRWIRHAGRFVSAGRHEIMDDQDAQRVHPANRAAIWGDLQDPTRPLGFGGMSRGSVAQIQHSAQGGEERGTVYAWLLSRTHHRDRQYEAVQDLCACPRPKPQVYRKALERYLLHHPYSRIFICQSD